MHTLGTWTTGLLHTRPWLHTVGAWTSHTLSEVLEDSEQDQQARPVGQGGRRGGSLTLRAGNWEVGWQTGCLKCELKDRDLISH